MKKESIEKRLAKNTFSRELFVTIIALWWGILAHIIADAYDPEMREILLTEATLLINIFSYIYIFIELYILYANRKDSSAQEKRKNILGLSLFMIVFLLDTRLILH